MHVHRLDGDITVLADHADVPGVGNLPVNAFVMGRRDAIVVDTGLSTPGTGFMEALASAVDPADVGWVYLTHPDRDHTGGLWELLEAAPQAKLVTTFLGVGILSCEFEVPMHRVHLLNPGQELRAAGRTVRAVRPPLFDSPATVGLMDLDTGCLVSSDCFGAPLPQPRISAYDDVRAIERTELAERQRLWISVDAPWAHVADPAAFGASVQALRNLAPRTVLSSHLPPMRDPASIDRAFDIAMSAPGTDPFVGPDQQALEELLASFEPAPVG
jgi:glyoxylase-like metal-dependent hydrolase (beta-lactamase superfamily II)